MIDNANQDLPYILELKGKIQNDCEISHSEPIKEKYFLENQNHYELIDTKIMNSIDDTTSNFNLQLAAKISYKEDFPETSFFKVPMRKGREVAEKGLGYATLTPNTLINKYNEVINTNIQIPNALEIESIFKIKNKKLEITLPPYMGVFINDAYIFSKVFNFNNADEEGFSESNIPKHFDKLPPDAEKIEKLNLSEQVKQELLFSIEEFYGFKNFTSDVIKIISDNDIPEQAIHNVSPSAKLKNELYSQQLQCYLDEIVFVAVDFFKEESKDILHKEERNIELNLFNSFFYSILSETVLSLVKSVVSHLVPSIDMNDIQLEWNSGSFNITLKNYSKYKIDFTFFGNKTLFSLLGFAHYSSFENMMLPKQMHINDCLLRSNIKKKEIDKRFIMQPFPYYIVVKNASEAENLILNDGKKVTILGLLNSDSSFISTPIKINSNKKVRITLMDFDKNPLKYEISMIIHLKCI